MFVILSACPFIYLSGFFLFYFFSFICSPIVFFCLLSVCLILCLSVCLFICSFIYLSGFFLCFFFFRLFVHSFIRCWFVCFFVCCLIVHLSVVPPACLFAHSFVCLSVHCLIVHLSVCLSARLFVSSFVCLVDWLIVRLSVCLSAHLFIRLIGWLLFCLSSVCLSVRLSVCLSACLFVRLCVLLVHWLVHWLVHLSVRPSVCFFPFLCSYFHLCALQVLALRLLRSVLTSWDDKNGDQLKANLVEKLFALLGKVLIACTGSLPIQQIAGKLIIIKILRQSHITVVKCIICISGVPYILK